jgi:hypothetical protein
MYDNKIRLTDSTTHFLTILLSGEAAGILTPGGGVEK